MNKQVMVLGSVLGLALSTSPFVAAQSPPLVLQQVRTRWDGGFSTWVQFNGSEETCTFTDTFALVNDGLGSVTRAWDWPHIPCLCTRAMASVYHSSAATSNSFGFSMTAGAAAGRGGACSSEHMAGVNGACSSVAYIAVSSWTQALHPHSRMDLHVSADALGAASALVRIQGPIGRAEQDDYLIDFAIAAPPVDGAFPGMFWANHMLFAPGVYRVTLEGQAQIGPTWLDLNDQLNHVAISFSIQLPGLQPYPVPSWADVTVDGSVTPTDLLAWLTTPSDVNDDGVIDASPYGDDAATLAAILQGQGNLGEDCDENGFPDAYDIAVFEATLGTLGLADADGNGVPDLCEGPEPCGLADLAGPGQSPTPDGELTADDIIVFIGFFFGGDARADLAGAGQAVGADGEFTADDIIVFIGAFFAGC